MRSWCALSLILALGCGRSGLEDELLFEPGFDASTDFDVSVGDDSNNSEDGSVDASGKPPVKDASAPGEDAIAPPEDAEPPPPDDSGIIVRADSGGGGGGGGEPECDLRSCPTGCCYGNICAQGKQNIACGTNGFACANCLAFGETCADGTCVAPLR
jgi:hypothetical protein